MVSVFSDPSIVHVCLFLRNNLPMISNLDELPIPQQYGRLTKIFHDLGSILVAAGRVRQVRT